MTNLGKQLALLAHGGVDFIVIGGMAAAAHGSARATLDLDTVYSRAPENIARLATVLAALLSDALRSESNHGLRLYSASEGPHAELEIHYSR